MKLLTVSILLFALLALSYAADSQEETATQEPQAEEASPGDVKEETEGAEADPEEEAKEEPESDADTSEPSHVVKRATSCPISWTLYGSRCYQYFSTSYTWAQAERFCTIKGGNLASAQTNTEYVWLRNFIKSKAGSNKMAWTGGSDAQTENVWLWSDGSRFIFHNWCILRPLRSSNYNCMAIINSICGADFPCNNRLPFVCARKQTQN